MKAFFCLGTVAFLLIAGVLLWTPAQEAEAGPQLWCADFAADTPGPSDSNYPYVCFWDARQHCPMYKRSNGEIFRDAGCFPLR